MKLLDTAQVAEYLKINEKKVYKMAKEGGLPATKVTGKWLFPQPLIDEWLLESSRCNTPLPHSDGKQYVVTGSHDFALELLIHTLRGKGFNVIFNICGSLAGLIALRHKSADIAGIHLLDGKTRRYNTSFVKKHFPDDEMRLLKFVKRSQGLIVRSENPLGIKDIHMITRRKVRFINRQIGSGTRILLDTLLAKEGISPKEIKGYDNEVKTHTDIAVAIAGGTADVGLGIKSAADALNLDFIPIAYEEFDLLYPEEAESKAFIQCILRLIQNKSFRQKIASMGGYEIPVQSGSKFAAEKTVE